MRISIAAGTHGPIMELLILLLLIVLNGLFSMSEMAVVSSRKARLQQLADERRPGAKAALMLANEPTIFLSTIQVGITVIGITSGAFGEATIARQLSQWLSQWPALEPHSDGLAIAIVIAGVTLASLIIGELVPKRLALLDPESIASIVARPMRLLSVFAHPVVRTLSLITEGVLRLFGVRGGSQAPVSEEEIKVLMEQGADAGVFEQHEQALVTRVFRLDELRVTGVMTPRNDIEFLDLDEPRDATVRRIIESAHSRFPVVRGGLDDVEGIVPAKALLEDVLAGKPVDLKARLAKALFVPQTLTVMELVAAFKKHRQATALVVNEFGDLQGIVTLNDVMEALVGDIPTVEDEAERDVVRREDGSWLIDGGVTIERFKDVVGIEEMLPEEETGTYHTLAGFVMLRLERVPQPGDSFHWNGFRIEVVDMDRHRIDKLIVTPPALPAGDDGADE
jgi:putative hemolysin